MDIKYWLKYSVCLLSHVANPLLDSEVLLSYIINKDRTWIKLFDNFVLNDKQVYLFKKMVTRRMKYEPIAYIIQNKEFWSLPFFVSPIVLIPRPETEKLVEQSLLRLNEYDIILDLGIGCGNISLSIASEYPNCYVYGVDCIQEVVMVAKMNAEILNINNVNFYFSNWFSCIHNKFNLIVSNPPYLGIQDISDMQKEIYFEPYNALIARDYGISQIEYIIFYSNNYLLNKGWLLIEHAWNQSIIVKFLFQKYNFFNVESYKDSMGFERITVGQKLF